METLASERVIVAAPMSFTGSTQRLWRMTEGEYNPYVYWLLIIPAVLLLILCAWSVVLCWYLVFGILLIPYRIIRRGQRKDRRTALQHREMLESIQKQQA